MPISSNDVYHFAKYPWGSNIDFRPRNNIDKNDIVTEDIEEINGEPRIIKKLNFSQIRYGNCLFDMNKLIHRIIIGPSNNPEQLRTIFIRVLEKNGVIEAANKVVCSDIPVRI